MSQAHWSYDHIADVYATDMGKSMPFDDVAWYVAFARKLGGPALELGCGTGRILLPLIDAGIPVLGVDRSYPMLSRLRQDARIQGLDPVLAQMDMCALGISGTFRCIILAYSLITYVPTPAKVADLLRSLRTRLEPGGCLALDAFIPKPMRHYAEFNLDYHRSHADGTLERSKRVALLPGGQHRIDRRYLLRDEHERVTQTIETSETIRPYRVEELAELGRDAGFSVENLTYDYQYAESTEESRFFTLVLRRL